MNEQLAFVFPGQGSQKIGMLTDLAAAFPVVAQVFAQASDALGYDTWQLAQQGPVEQIDQTEYTQPLLLAADVAVWRCWQALQGQSPDYMAGHSLGEYAALVCAGAISFTDAIRLVAARGRYMQEAVSAGEGAMAAIVGVPDETVAEICQHAAQGQVVSPANYNSIGQVVIAGDIDAVNRAIDIAKQSGVKLARLIPVSVPSHCALMQPAAQRLQHDLAQVDIVAPLIEVIHNVDVKAHKDPQQIRDSLVLQLTQPVRWVETVQWFEHRGVKQMFECGPGAVLAKLNKRITPEVPTATVNTPDALTMFAEQFTARM